MDKLQIQAKTVRRKGKLTAIASTEGMDRSGDVLLVKNWDFSKFIKNPVLQAGHDYRPQYTVGKAENIRVEGNEVLFEPVFHTITPLAKQVKEMYEKGFLNAWSVGFIPGSAQLEGKSIEDGGTPNELLEVSAVAVPANAEALMKGFEAKSNHEQVEKEIQEFIEQKHDVEPAPADEVKEEAEEKAMQEVTTGETEDHVHLATFDDETGSGVTDEVNGHTHNIENFEVQESNGHTHTLDIPDMDTEQNNYGGKKKPKKKKDVDFAKVERWNKQLPEAFNKEFDIHSIDNVRMSFQNEIFTKFFECDVKNLYVNNHFVPSPLIGTYLSALKAVTSEYELVDTRNWHGDFEYPPLYEVIQLNAEKSDDFLVEGIQFYKVAGKNQVVLKYDVGWDGLYVSLISKSEEKEWNKGLLQKTHDWAKENNFLKGQKFGLSGEFIPATNKSWDDVMISKENETVVKRALKTVEDADKRSRGLLFMGVPGTGKTLTGKVMKDSSDATFIWVSSKDTYRIGIIGALRMAFKMARDLGPSILFIEDIDSWLKDAYGAMDLLKTEMDGVRENKGLITVLTSNEPENLPDALLDRPGRFHEVLNFEVPTKEVRKDMIVKWAGEVEEKALEEILEKTEGFSGAYMKELVGYAQTISEDEELSITDALIKSLDKLVEQRKLVQTIRQKGIESVMMKEGRIISKANRKKLESAKDAIEEVLAIEERQASQEEDVIEDVKSNSFTPAKEVKPVAQKMSDSEVLLKTLQSVAKISNQGLHKAKSK